MSTLFTAPARAFRFVRECLHWDKAFTHMVLLLALPMVAQSVVEASLHIVDGLMVSQLGDAAYSAVTQANRFTFIYNLFNFGICTGGAIFLSQYWGARDIRRMRYAMGMCLALSLCMAALFVTAALAAPRWIVGMFLLPGESFELAVEYLITVAPGYAFMAVGGVYSTVIKTAEKTYIPMLAGIVSIACNTLLNYAMIFGHFGLPAMGVRGAAYATVISAAVGAGVNIGCAYGMRLPAGAKLSELICRDGAFIKKFLRTTLPAVLNEGGWALGTSMYSVFYGRMGVVAVAATGVCNTVNDLVWVAIYALMNASAIVVGKTLGAGDRDNAYLYAKRMIAGGMAAGAVLGAVIIAARWPVVSIFTGLSADVRAMSASLLLIGGLTIWFRAFNSINVVGILRSGGDTVFSLWLDMGTLWLVGVPAVGLAALWLRLPLEAVYALTCLEEIVKLLIGVPHFKKKKWMNVLTGKEGGLLENA